MSEPADVELRLYRRDSRRHTVELHVGALEREAEQHQRRAAITLDLDQLRQLRSQPEAYGRLLGTPLFATHLFAAAWDEARGTAARVRLRLTIPADDAELHGLSWELLCDPREEHGLPLATSRQVLFARYQADSVAWPVRLRAKGDLRALALIAPTPPPGRAPADAEPAATLLRHALGPVEPKILGGATPATLAALERELRAGYEIVVVVAHARVLDEQPTIFLEDEQRAPAPVPASALAELIAGLEARPGLLVLAAPHDADDETLAALVLAGPALACAGVPGVLALHAAASAAVERRLQVFFEELSDTGQVDDALAAARAQGAWPADDSWRPVLFTRLKSGQLWYVPTFSGELRRPSATSQWSSLLQSTRGRTCTPIIGPDAIAGLVGSRRELARALADRFGFPLAPHDREGLPQVAQFIAVVHSPEVAWAAVVRELCGLLLRRHGSSLPPQAQHTALEPMPLDDLCRTLDTWLTAAWTAEQARNPAEPYRVLAALHLPVYVTAEPSGLLPHALRMAGREPHELIAPWRGNTARVPPEHIPSPDHPLVYRLAGSYDQPETLVLTEDNYFDYLIDVSKNNNDLPEEVRSRWVNSALMFLGFRPDDWAFRVFFRSLIDRGGWTRNTRHRHVAVQIAPEEGRTLLPTVAQHYFEEYFDAQVKVNVYWGDAADFCRALHARSPYPPRDASPADPRVARGAAAEQAATPIAADDKSSQGALREMIVEHFEESELITLCYDLGVDYNADIRAERKAVSVINLIEHFRNRGRLNELLAAMKAKRPHLDWDRFRRGA